MCHPNAVKTLQNDQRFKELLSDCCERLQDLPDWFDIRALANITQSISKLGIHDDDYFEAIAGESGRIARLGKVSVGDSRAILQVAQKSLSRHNDASCPCN